jgi:hypothetical protein
MQNTADEPLNGPSFNTEQKLSDGETTSVSIDITDALHFLHPTHFVSATS